MNMKIYGTVAGEIRNVVNIICDVYFSVLSLKQ